MKAKIEIPTGWRRLRRGDNSGTNDKTIQGYIPYWRDLYSWEQGIRIDDQLIIRKKRKAKK